MKILSGVLVAASAVLIGVAVDAPIASAAGATITMKDEAAADGYRIHYVTATGTASCSGGGKAHVAVEGEGIHGRSMNFACDGAKHKWSAVLAHDHLGRVLLSATLLSVPGYSTLAKTGGVMVRIRPPQK
ncbi:hypothetical protein [Nocardia sp. CS682]|uniref:hypothetical protein n=1 Tax=Nocardia sp. CS682 TaxID=1047172 RepID=UPI0010756CFB|nr:hypothetical protein [Nocardia sp. CS682]QBS43483.1 hypothetical protein DMB37_28625 [Nocardia sp. CS682]